MPSILARSSSTREQRSNGGSGTTHVFLNVYDLTPVNSYLYWFGFGVYHSGIEVHGMEYGYGAHEYSSSGVFEVEPKSCPGFIYRRSIWLGTTNMSRSEFRLFLEHLSGKYHGNTYHLISKNCNHFTDDVCTRLTGKPIPGWVNRLARLGSFCNCLLPESIQVAAVRHLPDNPAYSGAHFVFYPLISKFDGCGQLGLVATSQLLPLGSLWFSHHDSHWRDVESHCDTEANPFFFNKVYLQISRKKKRES